MNAKSVEQFMNHVLRPPMVNRTIIDNNNVTGLEGMSAVCCRIKCINEILHICVIVARSL